MRMAGNVRHTDLPEVLCVDDEPQVLAGLAVTLGKDYSVTTANSASDALALLRAGRLYAALVTDFRMPGTDGIALL
ncbi:MAG: response regulator [Deltaproteobacteria bacterium]|nr:response regulator [Deltaproteobacteria bacterium]